MLTFYYVWAFALCQVHDQDVLRICKLAQVGTSMDLQRAVLLAITGWKAKADRGKINLLVCDFCCREVGTCLYKTAALSELPDSDANCPKAKDPTITSITSPPRGIKRQHQEVTFLALAFHKACSHGYEH